MFEQLKGRPDITPIQERLMLYVHIKRQKQRLTEMQITALSTRVEATKQADALIEAYRKQLFPGIDKYGDQSLERAKAALAAEAGKVYVVKRLDSVADLRASVRKAADAGATELAKAGAMALRDKERSEARVRERLRRK